MLAHEEAIRHNKILNTQKIPTEKPITNRTKEILYSPTNISFASQEQKPLQEKFNVKVVPRFEIKSVGADRVKYIDLSLDKNMTTRIEAKLKVVDQTNFTSSVEFQPASIRSPIPHSLPNATDGIKCKERSFKPRMEMRGTNYWALYNYIPADEVTYC